MSQNIASRATRRMRRVVLVSSALVLLGFGSQSDAFEALIRSEAGEYVGGGQTYDLTDTTGTTVTEQADGSGIRIGWAHVADVWTFKFAGPNAAPLQIGTYSNAERQDTPFQEPGHPGMDISGLGRGCNMLSGSFIVRDVAYDAGGVLTRLAVDATQYCENGARALRVYLRFGDTTIPVLVPTTQARAGADQIVSPASAVTLDGSQSVAQDGGLLAFAWTQAYGPATPLSGASTPTPSFTAPTPAAEWSLLTYLLTVTDSQQLTSSATVNVLVAENTQPRSEIRMVSTGGDPVGQGLTLDEIVDPTRLTINRNISNGIDLSYVFSGSSFATLRMQVSGPNLAQLRPQRYELAYRNGGSTGIGALDASLALGCGQSISRFDVRDVAYDDNGAVVRLALDFEQYCLDIGGAGPLLGYIRINSVVPIVSRVPTAWAGLGILADTGQSITLDAGGSTGGLTPIAGYAWTQVSGPPATLSATGSAATFTAPAVDPAGATLVFQVAVTNSAGFTDTDRVAVHVQGSAEPRFYIQADPSGYDFVTGGAPVYLDQSIGALVIDNVVDGFGREHATVNFNGLETWSVDVTSAQGQQLAPGVYPDLDSIANDKPGISLSGGGRGCDRTVGYMAIHEILRDSAGKVTGLAVDFVTRCDHGAPTFASVRFGSTVPATAPTLRASAGAPQGANGGDNVTLSADLSYPGASSISSYSWQQLSGPAVVLGNSNSDRPTFVAPAGGGSLQFQVTVTTADGQTDTSVVTITVAPTGTPRTMLLIQSDPGFTLTFGQTLSLSDSISVRSFAPLGNGLDIQLTDAYVLELLLWAPLGADFVPGQVYEGARMYNGEQSHRLAGFPGIEAEFDSFYCNETRGRFVVRELAKDSSGNITKLAVDFQQTCVPENGYVRASVRVNSAVPVGDTYPLASAGPDLVVRAAQSIDADGRASSAGPSLTATYQWRQISGPTLGITGATSPVAHVTAPALASGTADAVLELTVTDSAAQSASARMKVTVVGDTAPFTQIVAAQYTADGTKVADYDYDANTAYFHFTPQSDPAQLYVGIESNYSVTSFFALGFSPKLVAGSYSATDPYQFVFGGGPATSSCPVPFGALRILEATYNGNDVSALAYDFDLTCGTSYFAGEVRINSAAPIEIGKVLADAGPDQVVTAGDIVALDGTRSLIVGTPISDYHWTQSAGPAVTFTPCGPGAACFSAPSVTTTTALQFRLAISALVGTASGSSTVTVTVNPKQVEPPPPPPPPPPPNGGSGSSGGGGGGATDPIALAMLFALAWLRTRSVRRV